jgi:hypothetical protein
MKHLNKFNENIQGPGKIHDELKETLKKWLVHYTNEELLSEFLDKNLPLEYISDKDIFLDKDNEDIRLAIKLLRRM